MRKSFLLLFVFSLLFVTGYAQKKTVTSPDLRISIGEPNPANQNKRYLFNGEISGEDGTPLEGINLLFAALNDGTITNKKGKFAIRLPNGKKQFTIEGLGFKTLKIKLSIHGSAAYVFTLEEQAEALDEVVLLNRQNDNVDSEMIGKASIMALETKNIPLVLGEQNLLKAATILPGISSAGEAGQSPHPKSQLHHVQPCDALPVHAVLRL